jgi:putative oxidoreductase
MRIVVTISRILLGLLFFVFGLNGFLNFIPTGPMPNGLAGEYMDALFKSHYIWLIAGCQVIGGALLLLNRYATLGLVILGPVLVNILAYHISMHPSGMAPGLVCTLLWLILAWHARGNLAGIFAPRIYNERG